MSEINQRENSAAALWKAMDRFETATGHIWAPSSRVYLADLERELSALGLIRLQKLIENMADAAEEVQKPSR
jgi:hypothetical protein